MIIKSFELDKINVKNSNFYLFYGENEGYKNEAIEKMLGYNFYGAIPIHDRIE